MSKIKYDPFLNKLDKKENFKDTLSAGNKTEGNDLEISHGDSIYGELSGNAGNGGDLNILGGSSLDGNAGDLLLAGGASLNGNGGDTLIAGGTGANGGDVHINPGTPIGGGLSGDIFLNNLKWPQTDGLSGYVLSTDGNNNLAFISVSAATDSTSADINYLSGAIDINSDNINTLSADLSELSAAVEINTNNIVTTKDLLTVDSLSSRFFAYENLEMFNTAKWLITAVNPVSSTLSVFEVLGTQINNIPRHSRSNIIANELNITTDVIISGSSFGINVVNNENENITIEYIRIT